MSVPNNGPERSPSRSEKGMPEFSPMTWYVLLGPDQNCLYQLNVAQETAGYSGRHPIAPLRPRHAARAGLAWP